MNPFRWLRNSQNGEPPRGCPHDVGQDERRPHDLAHRPVPETADLDLADPRRGAFVVIGLFVRRAIETTMREGLQSELQTLVDVEAAMLETWYQVQESNAESLANNVDIRQTIYPLLETTVNEDETAADTADTLRAKLDKSLGPALTAHDTPATSSPTRRSGSSPPGGRS